MKNFLSVFLKAQDGLLKRFVHNPKISSLLSQSRKETRNLKDRIRECSQMEIGGLRDT